MRVASLYHGIFRAATMNADRIPRDLVRRRSHDNTHFERARTRSSAAIRGSGLAPSAGAELSGQGRPARRAAARRRRD